jgi:hypothetical protein
LFTLTIHGDSNLETNVGQAAFTRQYVFNEDGLGAATFGLSTGRLVGGGSFTFNAERFTPALRGGSGKYEGRTGVVEETPAANHAQRFVFVFS